MTRLILMAVTPRTVRDYTPYVLHARRMQALRRADTRIAARLDRAWAAAREIADFLRRTYQPARIIAFGSIVHPEVFGHHSDIDIAVEGMPWPDYLRAWNDVEERVTEFKVDLIDVAVVGPELRQSIEEEGQPI